MTCAELQQHVRNATANETTLHNVTSICVPAAECPQPDENGNKPAPTNVSYFNMDTDILCQATKTIASATALVLTAYYLM